MRQVVVASLGLLAAATLLTYAASFFRAFHLHLLETDDSLCVLLVADGQVELQQARLGDIAPFGDDLERRARAHFDDFKTRMTNDDAPLSHYNGRFFYHETGSGMTIEYVPTNSHSGRVRRELLLSTVTGLPIWLPLELLVVYPTVALIRGPLRRWRRRRRGLCVQCGYDLTGNVSGRCPECGQSPNRVD